MFAKDVKGADIKALQQVVIDSKNKDLYREFAKIEGADRKLLLSKVNSPDAEWIETEINTLINEL